MSVRSILLLQTDSTGQIVVRADGLSLLAFSSADCLCYQDAYGINHHKQKKRAYTSSEQVLIDAVGAKQEVNRVN
jgi:hypothetical protein